MGEKYFTFLVPVINTEKKIFVQDLKLASTAYEEKISTLTLYWAEQKIQTITLLSIIEIMVSYSAENNDLKYTIM